jgi:hypothetical protein
MYADRRTLASPADLAASVPAATETARRVEPDPDSGKGVILAELRKAQGDLVAHVSLKRALLSFSPNASPNVTVLVRRLRGDGWPVENVRRKGYRLIR